MNSRSSDTDAQSLDSSIQAILTHAKVLEIISEGVQCVDGLGIIRFTNPAFDAIFGYESGELIGRHVSVLNDLDAGVNDKFVAEVLDAVEWKGDWTGEVRNRKKDGTSFVTWAKVKRLPPPSPVSWVSVQIDITQQKRAEAESWRTAHLLQAVADETTDAVFVKDRAGKYLLFNEAAARFVGLPVADVLGNDDTALFDADSARRVMARDREVMESGRTVTREEELTAAGITRTYLASKSPLRDERGNVVGLIGISRDITERKAAQAAIEAQRQRMEGIINSAIDGIITIDEDQRVVVFNAAAERMFGYRADEVLGQSVEQLIPEQFRARHSAHVREFGETGVTTRGMGTFGAIHGIRSNGEEFPMEASISQILLDGKKLFSVTCRDVTERLRAEETRQQLEEQLRQSQKMEAVGQLAGGIAHDFNNLLTVILGHGDLLLAQFPGPDPRRGQVAEILEAGEKAASLTRQLLAFSRKQFLAPKVLDLNNIVRNTQKLLLRLIGEDIRLTTVLDPSLQRVKVDPGQMEQVIVNLAVNSRDAMPQGGTLIIETREVILDEQSRREFPEALPGHYVMLRVIDTGCGMPPEVRARIFEPFFTTKGPEKGTGLGLSTVYGILRQSDGHIAVDSEPDTGTSFKILLPVVTAEVAANEDSPRGAIPGGREAILLVEDEAGVRQLVRRILENYGYTVLEAANGREGIRVAEAWSGPIDLLITDVVMPELSGRQMAEILCLRFPALKVLYMSGYTDDAVMHHGVIEMQRAFLQKPFSPLLLAKKVREVLEEQSHVVE